jgi:hypothetical protein
MTLLRRPAMISFTRPWNCPPLSWTSFACTRSTGMLTAAGKQVRLASGSAKAGRLLWPAVRPDSKHEAQALFAPAR